MIKKIKIPKKVREQFNKEKHPSQQWDGKPISPHKLIEDKVLSDIDNDIKNRGKDAILEILDGKWKSPQDQFYPGALDVSNPLLKEVFLKYKEVLLEVKRENVQGIKNRIEQRAEEKLKS